MNLGVSIWLDVLRVIATFVVVVSHWAYPRFTDGQYIIVREWNLGSDAVVVFFVISGCVIAFAAGRDRSPGLFAFNRLTRLWSVLIPALILTVMFDTWGNRIDPTAYPVGFYNPVPVSEFLFRGITFSNQWTLFEHVRLGTNGPLWSLSYEAAYYALFGVAVFVTGFLRLVLLVGMIVVFGWNVMLLMPAWLLGVWLWRALQSGVADRMSYGVGLVCALAGPALYVVCHVFLVPEILLELTKLVMGVHDPRTVISFSDEFLWNALIGVLTVMHVMGVARLLRGEIRGAHEIRWLAGASFSVYVTHYPALHLLDAMVGDTSGRDMILLLGSISIGFVFASLFERPIGHFRRWLKPAGLRQDSPATSSARRTKETLEMQSKA